eukprot:6180881-Pleurochrysis_carterae.AAC.1
MPCGTYLGIYPGVYKSNVPYEANAPAAANRLHFEALAESRLLDDVVESQLAPVVRNVEADAFVPPRRLRPRAHVAASACACARLRVRVRACACVRVHVRVRVRVRACVRVRA